MSISHHPSEATLFAYAAGSLSEGLALVVATHLALCPSCRGRSRTLDAVGGALLDSLPPAPMADDALGRVMRRLDAPERASGPAPSATAAAGPGLMPGVPLPQPLAAYVGRAPVRRWRVLAPGIQHVELLPRSPSGGGVRLLRVAPGRTVSLHGHGGTELALVLEGSYTDELGRFAAGDLAETDAETSHRPVADAATGCLCVVASDAPTRFKTLIGRLLQPWLRV